MKKFLITGLCVLVCGVCIAKEAVNEPSENAGGAFAAPTKISEPVKSKLDVKHIELVKIPCIKKGSASACKSESIAVETTDNPAPLNWSDANMVCKAKGLRLSTAAELYSMLLAAQEGIIHPLQQTNYWAESIDEESANSCYMGFGSCGGQNKEESLLPFRCVENQN